MKFTEMVKLTKKKSSENAAGNWNFFGALIRIISYPVTWILLPFSITPNQVTFLSLLCTITGFVFMILEPGNKFFSLIGLLFFFIWNIFDCVDGNIARIKKQFSSVGDLWDAAAGYSSLCLMFFAMGINGFIGNARLNFLSIVIGGLSGMLTLYPRLLMHFKYHGEVNEINNINKYGFVKMVIFNIVSPDALVQPFMLLAFLLKLEGIFTICYFILHFLYTIYTCMKLFKE